jgi:hypothetical protein
MMNTIERIDRVGDLFTVEAAGPYLAVWSKGEAPGPCGPCKACGP